MSNDVYAIQNLTDMLKGWMFEAFMVGVVVVMMGQILDNTQESEKIEKVELSDDFPRP